MSQPPTPGPPGSPEQPPQPGSSGDWPDPYAPSQGGPPTTPSGPPAGPGHPTYPAYPQSAFGPPPAAPPGYGYPPPYGYPAPAPTNGLAIASLVCSLAGLAVGVSAPVGAILGHVARRQIRERGEQGDGMALAGIVVGWILTGIIVLCCAGYIGVIGFAISQDSGSF
ncbi:MAG: DUF4190 domain-containing protein [Micromonosporaceae bacterium]|nr:DUF4190 domain-containing protein [Micromonosporaceae bacterium]